jgi:4-hydroxybenzoate polyprenyltransferase
MKREQLLTGLSAACAATAGLLAFSARERLYIGLFFLFFLIQVFVLRKKQILFTSSLLLSQYIVLAAAGMITNQSSGWLLTGVFAALVAWDQSNFQQQLVGDRQIDAVSLLRKKHTRVMLLALGLGCGLVLLGLQIRFQLPFAVIVFLLVALLLVLEYGMRFFSKIK